MAGMAWCVGFILAVHLLGCTRICQMAPESRTVPLNWTYRYGTIESWTNGGTVDHDNQVGEDTYGPEGREQDPAEPARLGVKAQGHHGHCRCRQRPALGWSRELP